MNADLLKKLGLQAKPPTGDPLKDLGLKTRDIVVEEKHRERFRQSFGLAPTHQPGISAERVAEINQLYGPGRSAEQMAELIHEENTVMRLGSQIGFGRLMQAARDTWADIARQDAERAGRQPSGGHFTIGPCASLVVPCECTTSPCYWCCGTNLLTEKVKQAKEFLGDADLTNKQES